jgi:hypothetical protein
MAKRAPSSLRTAVAVGRAAMKPQIRIQQLPFLSLRILADSYKALLS